MKITIQSIAHSEQRYNTPGDWFIGAEPRPHVYGPSLVGHGEGQCIYCKGTNRENAVLSPNHCEARDPSTLCITVSDELCQIDERFGFLIAIHELVEALLCRSDGVTQKEVDAFDMTWQRHQLADGTRIDEPGEDPRAPYYKQHTLAEIIERLCSKAMHVHWGQYGTAVDAVWHR